MRIEAGVLSPRRGGFFRISCVSELEYFHPEEGVLYYSSRESYPGFYRTKLAASYRGLCVSENGYFHPLDAILYREGSFDHIRPVSEVKYAHPEKSISYDSSCVL